ncbi:MAG: glycosyltransferase family 4 protein [Gemmatimonadales bacterium]
MNILMQCMYFPPEVGGLESHVYTLCRELVRRGHRVTMLTSRSRRGLARRDVIDGIDVRRVWMPSRTPAGWISHAAATTPVHYGLARDADVFHAQDFAAVPPAWPARWRYRRPLVLTVHTSHFLVRARRPVWKPILRRIVASADYLLAPSRELLDTALSLYPHRRAQVLLNAVDTETFRHTAPTLPPTTRRRVVVPRRLFPKNGVEYFVRALPRIARDVDVEAVVVGDGPERSRLDRLAAELGLEGRIRFLGSKPHAEMPGIFSSAEIAVIPSLMEASSVAALEALACGIPVAASRVGGLPEIIDESVGTLFEPGNPDALAEAVVRALSDREGLVRKGDAARRRVVDRFSLGRLVDRHVEIYHDLLGAARG